MDKHQIFAKNLKAIREIDQRSLSEFSKELGIPKSTLQSVLNNGNTTLDTALRISEGLDLPLDSLTGDSRLAEKLDVVQYLLQGLSWFQALSAGDQEEIVLHLRKILEVMRK